MRLLIQSTVTHQFLHWSPVTGAVDWTPSLHTALAYGLTTDEQMVLQLVEEYCDGRAYAVVDIDNVPDA